MNAYSFKFTDIRGKEQSLEKFRGKAILVVNTASQCGFTPQYEGLQDLYEKYQDKLEIVAFPCNQFGGQEPGDEAEISSFCDLNFKTSFSLAKKIEVNGEDTHPLFKYLKSALPGILGSEKVKWNFTKFLIDPNGNPVKRYAPTTTPASIEKDLLKLF